MKNLKSLAVAFTLVLFVACSSDDGSSLPSTPTTIQASGSINWSSFNSATSPLNITSLVTIGGQPSNTYTVNSIPGDKVTFTFNTGKSITKRNLELKMVSIDTPENPTEDDRLLIENIEFTIDPNDDNYILGFEVLPGAPTTLDAKFDIIVDIFENGQSLGRDYRIDPKIKIRSTR